jgi:membrane protein DedA with SNARE-associated domain
MTETGEILKQIAALSYAGIFGASFLANIVVPVPEEVIILAIGYVAGTGTISFWITLPIVIAGMLLSDIIMFSLSLHGNKIVRTVYDKFFAKIVPMNQEFIEKHITKIIFVSRFLVNLRFIGPFLAGQAKVSYRRFILIDGIAITAYAAVLLWAGHYFSSRIESIFSGVGIFKNVLLIVIALLILWSVGQAIKKAFLKFEKKGEVKQVDTNRE